MQAAHVIAVSSKGANEGGESNNATVCKQLAHFTNAPDILCAVYGDQSKMIMRGQVASL